MQRIPVDLTNYCDGNQLNYNNDLPAIEHTDRIRASPLETG